MNGNEVTTIDSASGLKFFHFGLPAERRLVGAIAGVWNDLAQADRDNLREAWTKGMLYALSSSLEPKEIPGAREMSAKEVESASDEQVREMVRATFDRDLKKSRESAYIVNEDFDVASSTPIADRDDGRLEVLAMKIAAGL